MGRRRAIASVASTQHPASGAQERKHIAQVAFSTYPLVKGKEPAPSRQHIYCAPVNRTSGDLRPQVQHMRPILQHSLLSSFVTIPKPRESSPTARQHSSTRHRHSCLDPTPILQSPQLHPLQQQIYASDTQVVGILLLLLFSKKFVHSRQVSADLKSQNNDRPYQQS